MAEEAASYPMPKHGWTCFHCGETFTTPGAARWHFGADPLKDPACQIKVGEERGLVAKIRRLEAELDSYRLEDTQKDRDYHALVAEKERAVRQAEEDGYNKGVRDMKALEPSNA